MDVTPALYTDFSDLQNLKYDKSVDEQARLKAVAKQFEGIFLQMMLKSMRDANIGEELFDNDQVKMYQDLFDKQVALELGNSRGVGLADMLAKQLDKSSPEQVNTGKNMADYQRNVFHRINELSARSRLEMNNPQVVAATTGNMAAGMTQRVVKPAETGQVEQPSWDTPEGFIESLMPHARTVAGKLGLHPAFIVAQAALETGWGEHVMKTAEGHSSHNLFGIKAGSHWQGNTVSSDTLEFRDGVMKQEKAAFRSYSSLADAFHDYAKFLSDNPRYRKVVNSGTDVEQFSNSLSKAGYATDPAYANKIRAIVQSERMKPFLNNGF